MLGLQLRAGVHTGESEVLGDKLVGLPCMWALASALSQEPR